MAADPRKRQKKLEKRNAKRKAKHHDLARANSAGLPERLAAAARYPVIDSFAGSTLWERGMGPVVLARALPDGRVAIANFLLDRYCLGVKDAFARIVSRFEYDHKIIAPMRSQFSDTAITPETARQFVESAVEYARSLGFEPHPDYYRARLIFGDLDPAKATAALELGDNGKPLYMAGPFDDRHRQQHILSTLTRTVGPDGFHFVLPAGPLLGTEPRGWLKDLSIDDEFDEDE